MGLEASPVLHAGEVATEQTTVRRHSGNDLGSGSWQTCVIDTKLPSSKDTWESISTLHPIWTLRGLSGVVVEFSPPTSEDAGSNLGLGTSYWKVGSYMPMPGGLQCSMH